MDSRDFVSLRRRQALAYSGGRTTITSFLWVVFSEDITVEAVGAHERHATLPIRPFTLCRRDLSIELGNLHLVGSLGVDAPVTMVGMPPEIAHDAAGRAIKGEGDERGAESATKDHSGIDSAAPR
jgi:hypothetical protein